MSETETFTLKVRMKVKPFLEIETKEFFKEHGIKISMTDCATQILMKYLQKKHKDVDLKCKPKPKKKMDSKTRAEIEEKIKNLSDQLK